MFDAFDGPTNQDKRIINLVEERSRGLVVVANKMDTVPELLKDKVRDWVKKELQFADYAPVMYTSVLEGQASPRPCTRPAASGRAAADRCPQPNSGRGLPGSRKEPAPIRLPHPRH